MKINCECYAKRFGNNNITEALSTGDWGFRLDFEDEASVLRASVVLSREEAKSLMVKIGRSIAAFDEAMENVVNPLCTGDLPAGV